MNVGIGTKGRTIPSKEIHKWDFPCSVEERGGNPKGGKGGLSRTKGGQQHYASWVIPRTALCIICYKALFLHIFPPLLGCCERVFTLLVVVCLHATVASYSSFYPAPPPFPLLSLLNKFFLTLCTFSLYQLSYSLLFFFLIHIIVAKVFLSYGNRFQMSK
jgi:hypothetical protein